MRSHPKQKIAALVALAIALTTPGLTQAQTSAAPSGIAAPVPQPETLVILIRTTLIALNQANQTGNYAIFHGLATAGFQASSTADKLNQSFAPLRSANLDLSPIAVVTPELTQAPAFTKDGVLRLTGRFPTLPVQINFDMAFQQIAGRWLIAGLAVDPVQVTAAAPAEIAKPVGRTANQIPPDKKKAQ